ncbi:hypothetical protein TPR58_13830 [Sphingomonas sp. HF-S3]|uniref:Uncharacterized protein n=1 Tax=Sphingomonas rustica TaxID=3103142 RepID=A0ABV0BBY0_9SPHN
MIPRDTHALAAELRACAERASDQERADLLLLVAGYELLADAADPERGPDPSA